VAAFLLCGLPGHIGEWFLAISLLPLVSAALIAVKRWRRNG
jgi:hypothetical protein